MNALREAWEHESHPSDEGRARIDEALEEYNSAATALTKEWNRRYKPTGPPKLEPIEEPAKKPASGDGEEARPELELGGPGD